MRYEQRLFLRNFIQQPKVVGSIAPSSKYLSNSMLKNVDFDSCNCIVEYGAGTGIFTKEIISRKRKNTLFISFELNRELYNEIKDLHSPENNIFIVNDSVENMTAYLHETGFSEVDYIISGLPFTVLPREVSMGILEDTYNVMGEKGVFITFQYSLHFYSLLKDTFPSTKLGVQILNIPPAFIYSCKK